MAEILPVFLPFAACGNRCVFCDQGAITGLTSPKDLVSSARLQIEKWLSVASGWRELAFYGGNFGALPKKERETLYGLAFEKGIRKIRFSTRPDTITKELTEEAEEYKISLIELGVQSLSDRVLKINGRPYDKVQVLRAVENIASVSSCGVQMMTGMWGQSYVSSVEDAAELSKMPVKTARIYPTLVFKNTRLEILWKEGRYRPTELFPALLAAAGMYIHFMAEGVRVIRMGLPYEMAKKEDLAAGVRHASFGDMVKTLTALLYMDQGGEIPYSGYRGLGRKIFGKKFSSRADLSPIDFVAVCREVRREFCEDSGRFFEGKAADFARRLESAAYDG